MTRLFRHLLIALAPCFALIAGCGSDTQPVQAPPPHAEAPPPPPHVETAQVGGMDQFRANLVQSQSQIDSTLASLNQLTDPNQQDLHGAYDKYCDQLARMKQQSETLKTQADTMRASRDTYFSGWEDKVSQIDNPTIRASAEARRKRLRDAHEQIVSNAQDAKDAYVPFMKDLQDIRTYLASDLSKSSVADLGGAAQKVQGEGQTVKEKLGNIIKTLDDVQTPPASTSTGGGTP